MPNRLAVAIALFVSFASYASGLAVSPVLIKLDVSERTALVKVTNDDAVPHGYQLELKSWSEDRTGKMGLTPTRDVIFFPQMLKLGPGESRNVRVGITSAPSALERSYRLFIQELPRERQANQKSVQVLTRVGIPIFVTPGEAKARLDVSKPSVDHGTIRLSVDNRGNAFARPEKVVVTLVDAGGGQVFQKTWNGWYILAHGGRDYTVPIPPEQCKKGVNLRAEVLEGGKTVAAQGTRVDSKSCGS
jgi:fimbrial chaperone protein